MRDYGPRLLDSIRESIAAAKKAEVPLVISHMYPSGRDSWGQARAAIELVEAARDRGVDVGYDVTPWLRGGAGIDQMLPPWAKERGVEGILDCIRDPKRRARLVRDFEQGGGWPGWLRPEWDDCLVCHVGNPKHRSWIGKTIAELAVQRGQSPTETALLMFAEDEGQYWVAGQNKCDADIDLLLSHPLGVPIADGFALAPEGPLAWQDRPNSYGTFPRVLGHYVRERGVLTWEEAVHKMAAIPAERLGLVDRGMIAADRIADLVIFDPATVKSCADYQHPQDFPVGIDWVIVNGEVTVSPEGHTGAASGEVL
jgi:N-acyl-D-amino-acid deacylase